MHKYTSELRADELGINHRVTHTLTVKNGYIITELLIVSKVPH
jgi:hypothetical protein